MSHPQVTTYRRNNVIVDFGGELRSLLQIASGTAYGYTGGTITRVYSPGDVLVPDDFAGRAPASERVVCRQHCIIHSIADSPESRSNASFHAAKRSAQHRQMMSLMASLDCAERVEYMLRHLAQRTDAIVYPDGAAVSVTMTHLGEMVGCSREMVGRALAKLKLSGVVRIEPGGHLKIIRGDFRRSFAA
jgi:CRP-like cAMP-binding protein